MGVQKDAMFVTGGWGYNGNMSHMSEHTGGSCVCHRELVINQHVNLGSTYRRRLCHRGLGV